MPEPRQFRQVRDEPLVAVIASYPGHLARLRADEPPVRSAHAVLAGAFAVPHRDPFDHMLAAQAIVEGATLLAEDPAFAQFPELQTRW